MRFRISRFSGRDLAFAEDLLVMTAKDAVKCQSFNLTNAWQVPVVAKLSAAFYQKFDQQFAAVRQRKQFITY